MFATILKSALVGARVRKFNPYHDAKGRFTTRENASMEEDMEKQAEWLNEKAKGFGYKDVDDMMSNNLEAVLGLAEVWRKTHTVAKANPYRDANNGQFTSKDKASYQGSKLYDQASALGLQGYIADSGYMSTPEGKKTAVKMAETYMKYQKHMTDSDQQPVPLLDFLKQHMFVGDAKAVADKVQSSINAKKAWVSIYKKKSMDFVEGEYVSLLQDSMLQNPGMAQDKLKAKIAKKLQHAKQQFIDNGGDEAEFSKAVQASMMKAMGNPKEAPVAAPDTDKSPKWTEPASVSAGKAANAALGIHYYLTRSKHGADHPLTAAAYQEWQKSKDWLKANGVSSADISNLSTQQKQSAQTFEAQVKAMEIQNKAMAELNKKEALGAYKSAYYQYQYQGLVSGFDGEAAAKLDSVMALEKKALDAGLTTTELNAYKAEAEAQADKSYKSQQAVKNLLSGDLKSVLDYYDQNDANFKAYDPFSNHTYHQYVTSMVNKLTTEQRKAIQSYTGSGYTSQNKTVAQAGYAATPSSSSQAQYLSEALADKTLGFDMRLRRNAAQKWFWDALGVPEDKMDGMGLEDLQQFVGRTYTEKAFSSTSTDLSFTGSFSNTGAKSGYIQMNIRAKADIRGLNVVDISGHENEREVILDRGVTYVIRGIRPYSGSVSSKDNPYRYIVDVDAIGHV